MNYLALTESTSTAARASIPARPHLPLAHLSPSRTSAALLQRQQKEHFLIDDTVTALTTHLTQIADFADSVVDADTRWAAALGGGLDG